MIYVQAGAAFRGIPTVKDDLLELLTALWDVNCCELCDAAVKHLSMKIDYRSLLVRLDEQPGRGMRSRFP